MVFLSPELDGAMFGFGVMCYSNSVRRLRMMRRKFLHPPSTVGQRVRSPLRVSAACSIAGPWEHAGMMAAGAALGAGLSALNASEKIKMEERLMVQRLRNQSILPRAFARPPATPALAPAPSTRFLATARAQSSLPPAVLGGYAELERWLCLRARACECAVAAGGAGAADAGGDDY